jgi:hypothetical protein
MFHFTETFVTPADLTQDFQGTPEICMAVPRPDGLFCEA